jgi:hypothetical protein
VLGAAGIACFWSPLLRWFEDEPNAGSFALTAAMFVVYGLARRAGPAEGRGLQFAALPDDKFVISFAAYVVVGAALVTAPFWARHFTGWLRALLAAVVLVAALGTGAFLLLGNYYSVGPTETVDPSSLPHLGMQLVEYTALTLLCGVVGEQPLLRRWMLRLLPVLLLGLWARHHFGPAAVEE